MKLQNSPLATKCVVWNFFLALYGITHVIFLMHPLEMSNLTHIVQLHRLYFASVTLIL